MKRLVMLFVFSGSLVYSQDPKQAPNPSATTTNGPFEPFLKPYRDPETYFDVVSGAVIDNFIWRDKKWGTGLSGLVKAWGPPFGKGVIAHTTAESLSELIFKDDAHFRRSQESGLLKRSWYATSRTFTARSKSGKLVPAYSSFLGMTLAILISNQWRPQPRTGNNLTRAVISEVTSRVEENLLDEFLGKKLDNLKAKALRKIGLKSRHAAPPP